jgi:ATP-dependent Lon protease
MTNLVAKKGTHMPLLPLKDIVVFPHMIVPVFINEELCIKAVDESLAGDRKIFLSAFQVEDKVSNELSVSLEAPFDVYDIGAVCSIMRTRKLPDGRMKVLVQGISKAKVNAIVSTEGFPMVDVSIMEEPTFVGSSSEAEALIRVVRENLEKVVSLGKVLSPDILMILEDVTEPGRLADLVAANLGLKVFDAQSILVVSNPIDRLRKVHAYLSREIEVYQMQVRIQSQAKEEIGRMQREHYLREQMRAIKTELGDGDSKDDLDDLWKKAEALPLSTEAMEEVKRQLRRLERMHSDTSEATLTRTHVETMLSLPWGKFTEDKVNLKNVKEVLDRDHYGLDRVKDRIMEFLAVKKLKPDVKSPILCFVGPPGVGKTSLGRSIAESMGREFSRIALGGVRDEADIRGHRRTYVGAFPGRVIDSIKKSGSSNPIIMLDELDKLTSDQRGDPSSALLEVLDPEQNSSFVDHYLGVEFDLSKVMFIANANQLDTIPAPLRDRLEIIEVSGYTEEEKLAISKQYLIPKQLNENGLEKQEVHFDDDSVKTIIKNYTRESGLRGLSKQIGSVCRKIARQIAENFENEELAQVIDLTPALIQKHLGAEKFADDFYHKEPTIGVSLGMAYTQYGGEILAIETNLIETGKHALVLTGKLGEVMKESAQAALSFIRSRKDQFNIDQALLDKYEIHVHVPAGAIPKDGPSAGIAMATSMLSAMLGQAPSKATCMTGEITLHGKVLAIGGLKEKVLAAQREGLFQVILPEKNRANFDELPVNVKRDINVRFVKDFEEVFAIVFEKQSQSLKRPRVAVASL